MSDQNMNEKSDALRDDEMAKFLSEYPLYKKLSRKLDQYVNNIAPRAIYYKCDRCGGDRPFRDYEDKPWYSPVQARDRTIVPYLSGVYQFYYICTGCENFAFYCWVEFSYKEQWIRKVGQNPPWTISIPVEAEKDLGKDALLYKKALILMSQSYGIGACAYLRRMVENQINPLLQTLYDIKTLDGAKPDELQDILDAIRSKNFTTKIEAASALIPASLIVAGDNPVKLIHDQLSIGIHYKDDEDAMDVAMKIRAAFEYVIIQLNQQLESKKVFIDSIKSLRSK